jgi:hypothetical protein
LTVNAPFLFIASMDVVEDKEALFDEVYDTEHIPQIASVPGVLNVTRFRRRELTLALGGQTQTINSDHEPRSTVIYEISDPSVLLSQEWNQKVEAGRWASQVRPYTLNRRLVLVQRVDVRPAPS